MIDGLMDWLERARVFDTASLTELRARAADAEDPRESLLAHPRIGTSRLIEATLDVAGADEWICPGYAITERLGAGGAGVVYRAMRLEDGVELALKLLHDGVRDDAEGMARLEREVEVARRLSHPGLPWYGEYGLTRGDVPFIAMQLLAGRTVMDLMGRGREPLAEPLVWRLLHQMGSVLEHLAAHGVVHRDVKPANILVTDEGTAFLCDLGLALAPGRDDTVTAYGEVIGTPHFISPERAGGLRDLTIATDVYSLGATLYFAACGEPPFDAKAPLVLLRMHEQEEPAPPRVVNPELSVELADVIVRMLAKSPEDRPSPSQMVASARRWI